jgi:hypothetical protein
MKGTIMSYPVYYDGEIEVTPPLTEHDIAILLAVTNFEQTEDTRAVFDAIKASPEPDLPWHGGLITLSEGGASISPEDGESSPGFGMWLVLLIEHFFTPIGYVLNGETSWTASDDDYDRGCIFVKDNQIEVVDDLIHNAGPSWNSYPYADASRRSRRSWILPTIPDALRT